jgi:hypothetical protein
MQSTRLVITTPILILVLAVLTLDPRDLLRRRLPLESRRRLSSNLIITHSRQVPRRRVLPPWLRRAERIRQSVRGTPESTTSEAARSLENAVVLVMSLPTFFHA